MSEKSKIILALDSADLDQTRRMIEKTSENISIYKLGLEFFLAQGRQGVLKVQEEFDEIEIFLDLKLHDIPNTVRGACQSVADLSPRFLTVHAAGGYEMVNAAATALPSTQITAVTVLTSLDAAELQALDLPSNPQKLALALAQRAVEAGARAIVCSPHEVTQLREAISSDVLLITPGVRPVQSATDDQKRTMTPREAFTSGSDYVVIGRPITQATDPLQAVNLILDSLA
jgi:orotidine-5'-phosphate decarboxylase